MVPSRMMDGERRHDLDALRAGAMLLGLVLHGAMAYTGAPWIVQDSHSNGLLGLAVSAIHGFRMPVFFVMSGFFTALLWQKRGLMSLVKNRFKRIFLPLLLGLVTVIPVMNWVSMVAISRGSAQGQKQGAERDLWTLAKEGEVSEIEKRLAEGADVNELDGKYRLSPLSWAAVAGKKEAVEFLLASGAKQEAAGQSSTPLHTASLFGHHQVVKVLIEKGADVNAKSYEGKTPLESTQLDENTAQFVARMFGLKLDPEQFRERQKQTAKLLIESGGRTAEGLTGLEGKAAAISPGLNWLFNGSLFGHLWFLWHLCWLVAGFVLVALAVDRLGLKRPPAWLVVSPLRYLWLIPLTMIPQAMMGNWGKQPNFGPDTSLGLLPQPHVLLYYAIFFAFGATYFGYDDEPAKVGKHWRKLLALGILVLFPLGIGLVFGGRETVDPTTRRWLSVSVQAAYVWVMTFGLMGLFHRYCSGENKTLRYLSDSSYWLYLAHMPLIIWAQMVLQNWSLPAMLKFALVFTPVTGVLLLSYQYLVRYHWMGRFLNGPRQKPVKAEEPPVLVAT